MSTHATPVSASRRLDAGDPAVIEMFERAFYQGFAYVTHNKLIQKLWIWDHEGARLRTRIPYAEQALWGRYTGDRFDAGVALNVRLNALQSSAFGFSVPPDLVPAAAEGHVCEFMALFVINDNSLAGIFTFWKEVFAELYAAGFTHALATTAPKILPLYRRIGGVTINEADIEGEKRFFLRFDLTRAARWMERVAPAKATPELFQPRHLVTPMPGFGQALHLVDQELGQLIGRLLVQMNIVRGDGDEGFDLEVRHRAARAVGDAILNYLGELTAAALTAEQAALLERSRKTLAELMVLEEAVHDFSSAACKQAGPLTEKLTESFDLLLLTALRAWDNEAGECELLDALTRDDRRPLMARMLREACGENPTDGQEAMLSTITGRFAVAVDSLHRLFSVAR